LLESKYLLPAEQSDGESSERQVSVLEDAATRLIETNSH